MRSFKILKSKLKVLTATLVTERSRKQVKQFHLKLCTGARFRLLPPPLTVYTFSLRTTVSFALVREVCRAVQVHKYDVYLFTYNFIQKKAPILTLSSLLTFLRCCPNSVGFFLVALSNRY